MNTNLLNFFFISSRLMLKPVDDIQLITACVWLAIISFFLSLSCFGVSHFHLAFARISCLQSKSFVFAQPKSRAHTSHITPSWIHNFTFNLHADKIAKKIHFVNGHEQTKWFYSWEICYLMTSHGDVDTWARFGSAERS